MDDFLPVTPTETLMPFGSNGMSPLEGLRLFHDCLIQSWFWLQYRDSNTLSSAEKLMLWCFYCILVWLVVSYLKGYKSEETSLSQKEVCWLFVVQIDLKYYIRGGDWFALFPHSITLPRTNVWSFTNVLLLPLVTESAEAAGIVRQIAVATVHLHRLNIAHRDLKVSLLLSFHINEFPCTMHNTEELYLWVVIFVY